MKQYKHKHKIEEGFGDIFDSSLIDYSHDFEKADRDYKVNQITEWMNSSVFNTEYHCATPTKPNRRWKINSNFEIPAINGWITFCFSKYESSPTNKNVRHYAGTTLTEDGEIPDFIKIGKISHSLHVSNWGGQYGGSTLQSFKNFPKVVKKELIFDTTEALTTLKGIPIIDLRNTFSSIEDGGRARIDFKESCRRIGRPDWYPEKLFKEILLYCDFIKGTVMCEDEIKIIYGSCCTHEDLYDYEGWLRKVGNKKYFVTQKYYYVRGMRQSKIVHFTLDNNGELIEDNDW